MVIFSNTRKGFTLVEVLISVGILALVIGGATAVYLMSHTAWHEGSTQIGLQRRASIAMERMVRGMMAAGETTYSGIRGATAITVPDPANRIDYISADGVQRSFYSTADTIFYDPDTSVMANEIPVIDSVGIVTLNFVPNPPPPDTERVMIDLILSDQVRDKLINVQLITEVTLRN